MMKFTFLLFCLIGFTAAEAAAPFDNLSLQGYLKTSTGTPVDGTINGKISLYQNSVPCWNSGTTLIPIVFAGGAFAKAISGGISTGLCSGTLGSSQFMTPGPFTWTLDLDVDNNNTVETAFTNIPITPVPLAMVAEKIAGSISTSQLSGTISADLIAGGTFGASDGAALTNLDAANIASGLIGTARLATGTANNATFLRGDRTWQTISGEANTASNIGTGSSLFSQKVGVNLEFRTLRAASTKLSVVQNTSDVSIDVNEANLSLANIGGTLSGSSVSGGTFGTIDGSNLTNIASASLVGALPALSGAALTNLNASSLASGTVSSTLLPIATAAVNGIITTGTQTIAGVKTFNSAVTLASTLATGGSFALAKTDVATAGNINCLATNTSVSRLTGTTATVLNGISPGADGQILIVYTDGNIGTGLTVAHNNAAGCTNGRIFTNTNANIVSTIATSTAAYIFIYNLASLRWHLITAAQ